MKEAQLARLLIEGLPGKGASASKVDRKIGVLATRTLLQIQSVPSLMAHLVDFAVNTGKDGKARLQLDFLKLPKEILPELEKLVSADYFSSHRLLNYVKNGQARTGLEIEVSPKELEGDAIDYAY